MTELLTEKTHATIDEWLQKYPADQKRSAVLTALHAAQEQNEGWLSVELMDAVAEKLGLAKIQVYEVATFYDMYELKPCGKHKIRVCTNVSCWLRGSDEIAAHLKKRLGIDFNESTPDNKFMLKDSECLAACASAPMLQIDNKYYENLTTEKVDEALAEWEAK